MRIASTYRVVLVEAEGNGTALVRLDPIALHIEDSDGSVYGVRGDGIWLTAGEGAPLQSEVGYEGDDPDKVVLAAGVALLQSLVDLRVSGETIATTASWTVQDAHAGHEDADGAMREGVLIVADGPVEAMGATVSGQQLWLADDFTLIAYVTTVEFGGGSSVGEQRFSRWGEEIAFPAV